MASSDDPDGALRAATLLFESDPGRMDVRLFLARQHLSARRPAEAWDLLGGIRNVRLADAPQFFELLAFLALQRSDPVEARKALQRILALEIGEEKKELARRLLAQLDRAPAAATAAVAPVETSAGPEPGRPSLRREVEREIAGEVQAQPPGLLRAEGRFRQLMCVGGKAWLILDTGAKKLTFLVDQPERVVVRGRTSEKLEFACGPQKGESVIVGFIEQDKEKHDVDGFVRELEWLPPGAVN